MESPSRDERPSSESPQVPVLPVRNRLSAALCLPVFTLGTLKRLHDHSHYLDILYVHRLNGQSVIVYNFCRLAQLHTKEYQCKFSIARVPQGRGVPMKLWGSGVSSGRGQGAEQHTCTCICTKLDEAGGVMKWPSHQLTAGRF